MNLYLLRFHTMYDFKVWGPDLQVEKRRVNFLPKVEKEKRTKAASIAS